jgi:hypothetical protein
MFVDELINFEYFMFKYKIFPLSKKDSLISFHKFFFEKKNLKTKNIQIFKKNL